METNGFKPAESLEEANARLRKLEHALAVERDRVQRMTPIATFEEEEEFRKELEAGETTDGEAFIQQIIAELEAADGQR